MGVELALGFGHVSMRRNPNYEEDNQQTSWQRLFSVPEFPVLADVLPPFGRDGELVKNGVHRASRLTVGAIDTSLRVDVVHLSFIGSGDAIYGADI